MRWTRLTPVTEAFVALSAFVAGAMFLVELSRPVHIPLGLAQAAPTTRVCGGVRLSNYLWLAAGWLQPCRLTAAAPVGPQPVAAHVHAARLVAH